MEDRRPSNRFPVLVHHRDAARIGVNGQVLMTTREGPAAHEPPEQQRKRD